MKFRKLFPDTAEISNSVIKKADFKDKNELSKNDRLGYLKLCIPIFKKRNFNKFFYFEARNFLELIWMIDYTKISPSNSLAKNILEKILQHVS